MAEKRMFTKKIIDSDAFLDMPISTQLLYFHLNMRADDDGFVNNPKKILRMVGSSEDDLRVLIAKRFVIGFDTGVIVIKHWRMHNTLRKDRYTPTQYQEELSMLEIKDNNSYTEKEAVEALPAAATTWQPTGNQVAPQYSIDKISIDKDSIERGNKAPPRTVFSPPSVDDVAAYCRERGNGIDANTFVDYYAARNWFIGKTKMKDWKAAVRTWENRRREEGKAKQAGFTYDDRVEEGWSL